MIVINLPFPPSLNNLFINGRAGRFRSQKYDSWRQEAGTEIMRQRPAKCQGPVSINYEFQDGYSKRKCDIDNLVKAPNDLLVSHGIIEADDNTIVREIRMVWSREVTGVRVTISPAQEAPNV